jgi:hypothetical protein
LISYVLYVFYKDEKGGLMFTTFNLAVSAIALLAICAWLRANKKAESRLKKALDKVTDAELYQSPFQCVVMTPCNNSCRKALEYSAKPILMKNVPELPLLGCNVFACECSFVQQEDRRTGKDRRYNEVPSRRLIYANKRTLKDRRRDSIQDFLLPKYRQYN